MIEMDVEGGGAVIAQVNDDVTGGLVRHG
jgi:hypothetical protein